MGTKEKNDFSDLYKKRDMNDERNPLRRAVENLYEQVERNNMRLTDLVDGCTTNEEKRKDK
jgi:hypothetical protein|tara:strand:- start:910 stop:1092 length:183 start_codon:yes stop_codon:yes gene_type:complete